MKELRALKPDLCTLDEAVELTRLAAETLGPDVLLTGYVKKENMPLWLQMDEES